MPSRIVVVPVPQGGNKDIREQGYPKTPLMPCWITSEDHRLRKWTVASTPYPSMALGTKPRGNSFRVSGPSLHIADTFIINHDYLFILSSLRRLGDLTAPYELHIPWSPRMLGQDVSVTQKCDSLVGRHRTSTFTRGLCLWRSNPLVVRLFPVILHSQVPRFPSFIKQKASSHALALGIQI